MWTVLVILSCISELQWWFYHTELALESAQVGIYSNPILGIRIFLYMYNHCITYLLLIHEYNHIIPILSPCVCNFVMINWTFYAKFFSLLQQSLRIWIHVGWWSYASLNLTGLNKILAEGGLNKFQAPFNLLVLIPSLTCWLRVRTIMFSQTSAPCQVQSI